MRASGGVALAICSAFLAGCPGPGFDPACVESDWIEEPASTIQVEADTFQAMLGELVFEVPLIGGNWAEDFGDARFYGPAVLVGLGHETGNPCLLAYGRASLNGNRTLIRAGVRFCPMFWLQVPEQLMAAAGLIDVYPHEGRIEDVKLIDAVLDHVNSGLECFDLYPEELGDSLLKLYGPTTQTAGVAAMNLRYALKVGGPRGPERQEFGLRLIQAIDEHAYDANRGIYRFSARTDKLHLYPNAMMIIAKCLAYQAARESHHVERARATFDGIQPLKDLTQGNYRSPYSARIMGAKTEDYSTLSSQLYLITALCLLYENTGQEAYLGEARSVLRFVCTQLRDGGQLVHHWIDGHPAPPDDPEYYCSGCNLQALYAMWYMSRVEPRSLSTPHEGVIQANVNLPTAKQP